MFYFHHAPPFTPPPYTQKGVSLIFTVFFVSVELGLYAGISFRRVNTHKRRRLEYLFIKRLVLRYDVAIFAIVANFISNALFFSWGGGLEDCNERPSFPMGRKF